jgi:hypothetical protein
VRAARAREWCLATIGLNALFVLAEELLSLEGTAWVVVRAAVVAAFTVALVAWIVSAHRERQHGGATSLVGPVLLATVAVAGLLVLAFVVG